MTVLFQILNLGGVLSAQNPPEASPFDFDAVLKGFQQKLDAEWDLDPKGKAIFSHIISNGTLSEADATALHAWIARDTLADPRTLVFKSYGVTDADNALWQQSIDRASGLKNNYRLALKRVEWVLKLPEFGLNEQALLSYKKIGEELQNNIDYLEQKIRKVMVRVDSDHRSENLGIVLRAKLKSLGVVFQNGEETLAGARRYLDSVGFGTIAQMKDSEVIDAVNYLYSGKKQSAAKNRTFFLSPRLFPENFSTGPIVRKLGPFDKGCHAVQDDIDNDGVTDVLELCVDQSQAGAPFLLTRLNYFDGASRERRNILEIERDADSPCSNVCTALILDAKQNGTADVVFTIPEPPFGQSQAYLLENAGRVWSDPATLSLETFFSFPNGSPRDFADGKVPVEQDGASGGARLVLDDVKDFNLSPFRIDLGVALGFEVQEARLKAKGGKILSSQKTVEQDATGLNRFRDNTLQILDTEAVTPLVSGETSLLQHYRWQKIPNFFLATEEGFQIYPYVLPTLRVMVDTEARGNASKSYVALVEHQRGYSANLLFGAGLGYNLPLGDLSFGLKPWRATASLMTFVQTPSILYDVAGFGAGLLGPTLFLGVGRSL